MINLNESNNNKDKNNNNPKINTDFENLVLPLLDELFKFALRLTSNNKPLAEDLVQETMLRAYRAFDKFEMRETGIKPWLLKIMHNIYFTELTKTKKRNEANHSTDIYSVEDRHTEQSADFDIENIEKIDWEQFDEEIKNNITQLPDEYRAVLLLWAFGEFSYKEIADISDIPVGTVMSRLYRARKQLAQSLTNYAKKHRLIKTDNHKKGKQNKDAKDTSNIRNHEGTEN